MQGHFELCSFPARICYIPLLYHSVNFLRGKRKKPLKLKVQVFIKMWLWSKNCVKNKIGGLKTSTPLMLSPDPLFAVTISQQKELCRAPGRLSRSGFSGVCRAKDLPNSLHGSVRVFCFWIRLWPCFMSVEFIVVIYTWWPFIHRGGFVSYSGLYYPHAVFGRVVCQFLPHFKCSTFWTWTVARQTLHLSQPLELDLCCFSSWNRAQTEAYI